MYLTWSYSTETSASVTAHATTATMTVAAAAEEEEEAVEAAGVSGDLDKFEEASQLCREAVAALKGLRSNQNASEKRMRANKESKTNLQRD